MFMVKVRTYTIHWGFRYNLYSLCENKHLKSNAVHFFDAQYSFSTCGVFFLQFRWVWQVNYTIHWKSVIENETNKISMISVTNKNSLQTETSWWFQPIWKHIGQITSFPHVSTWKPPIAIGMSLKEGQILSSVKPFSTWVPELLLCQKLAKHLCLQLGKNRKNATTATIWRAWKICRIAIGSHIWMILLYM